MVKYQFNYRDELKGLSYFGYSFAFSALFIGQVIYINEHYIVGATLSVCALVAILLQFGTAVCAKWQLEQGRYSALHRTMNWHFWLNNLAILVYSGFVWWAVVIMYQRYASTPSP